MYSVYIGVEFLDIKLKEAILTRVKILEVIFNKIKLLNIEFNKAILTKNWRKLLD